MKALKFYKELKESEPSTSSRESEVASADEEAYPEKLAKIIKDGEYCAHQVFNADETGLFWKKMPTRTYIAKSEKTTSGFKAAKDRVTLLLCSNASGDRMLKPLLLNRSLKPRALKGKDLNTLPVHWMANKKAWVTTAIFTEWFNKCFVPEVENYMNEMGLEFKILLILDNAPGGEGFDDFGEHDIEELLVDEALNDDDILESMVDITKDLETVDSEPEEDVTPLDEKLLREGLQLSELYKELVPSQSLITDYLVKEKKITEVPEEALPCRSDDVILSSSDESDLAPIHKRVRTLSDSE
ncbi:tigger transposable element-derived protein 1 [Trichonephila clavipes]|uniref:Tigger transposable element-derived protein 1 n=1 Tax=Trichonephila clavipes TaxID=2585209 RepID=A0A8X6UVB2_TRICX|nr:tigger transposable element-derived protein 1 [Trichonephila clavipes]